MEILGIVDIPVYIILTFAAVMLLYVYQTWTFDFFKKQGIPGPKPYPFFGNTTEVGFRHSFHKWKQTYGKIFGIFMGREPVFVVSDLDMLKEIFVKSFNNFRNRRQDLLINNPFSLGVFFLEDAAWKRVRNIITPSFSGGKLRTMCSAINDCASTLVANFSRTFKKSESVNMKQYFGAFTMDVISRTAFCVKVDSQNDFNDPFTSHAKKLFSPSQVRRPFIVMAQVFPPIRRLLSLFNVSFFSNDVTTFFSKTIREMIQQREKESMEKSVKRTDFLQLLIDAEIPDVSNGVSSMTNGHMNNDSNQKQKTLRRLTTDEIIGQGILFFIAGYETTASTLNFASYALAKNPDVQEKAYQEIRDVLGDEEPTYDNIGKLKYLENVIIETLRLFPPTIALHRTAAETITIKGLTIPKGATVFIPALSIQRDPELFEDPDRFKPERKNGEGYHNTESAVSYSHLRDRCRAVIATRAGHTRHEEKNDPLSFLTFGFGPRICIGMRLALVEIKIALIHVLKKVRFETTYDTPMKMEFKSVNILQPKEDNMLKLIQRN